MQNVTVAAHPLAGHLLADLRRVGTPPERYRGVATRLASVLALEATASLPTVTEEVETPLTTTTVHRLGRPVVAVPILRAGLGMLTAVTDMFPDVGVGYVGLERDEQTLQPTEYYFKTPELSGAHVLLLDPMLATGGSAAFAANLLRERGATDLTLVCVIAAPEGIERLTTEDPDISIVTAAIDEKLNDVGYIVPGLGDFGDRLFGTF
ncbi:uracil phosphoribosyltransferase [Euzebya tangerina]|uniref:uracil phosphoribosyltransferase n=1 Tax=Euzebya tangerina TaxID=591198 RepID=UPI000E3131BC|nr:uracil phosphoribosyltransferase [Euzebya tangerina]